MEESGAVAWRWEQRSTKGVFERLSRRGWGREQGGGAKMRMPAF